jgi:hypothetical protein
MFRWWCRWCNVSLGGGLGGGSGGCQLVAAVMDPNITTISPVNKLHPHDDVLASGSSRSIFIWMPKEKFESELQGDDDFLEWIVTQLSPVNLLAVISLVGEYFA